MILKIVIISIDVHINIGDYWNKLKKVKIPISEKNFKVFKKNDQNNINEDTYLT